MKFVELRFRGRINRAKYWRIKLGIFFVNFFFHIWVALKHGHGSLHEHPLTTGGWILVGGLVCVTAISLWVLLAADLKRYHDRDKSGWWVMIVFIPLAGAVWLAVECGFLPGTAGPNRFGADPLAAKQS
jgi:uncharacterized membrane protein YhaH (DUF805 family)